jgi:hypothetical protein
MSDTSQAAPLDPVSALREQIAIVHEIGSYRLSPWYERHAAGEERWGQVGSHVRANWEEYVTLLYQAVQDGLDPSLRSRAAEDIAAADAAFGDLCRVTEPRDVRFIEGYDEDGNPHHVVSIPGGPWGVQTTLRETYEKAEGAVGKLPRWWQLSQRPAGGEPTIEAGQQAAPPQDNAGEWAKVAMVVGDTEAGKILAIVNDKSMSTDTKQRLITQLDKRHVGWKSPRWAKLLGVSEQQCRDTEWWKVDRKEMLEDCR